MSVRFIVSWSEGWVGTALQIASGSSPLDHRRRFVSPLSADELKELAWYYEVYPLNAGPSQQFRAARVEARISGWGVALFDALMPHGTATRAAWQEYEGDDPSLWLTGASGEFLGLPWELARMTVSAEPIGQRHRVTRAPEPPDQSAPVSLRRASRLLLVISRPIGSPAIAFLLFAAELVRQMRYAAKHVEVEVLRPPTFEAFCERIRAAAAEGRPFDIVHFDGHGSIGESSERAQRVARLTFETSTGGARQVDGAMLLAGLGGAEIPLLVLAACHSGEVATAATLGSSVAGKLVEARGATTVVAMSYAVCADAARLFLGEFYQAALRGEHLAQAVSRGRRQLALLPARRREHGWVDLQDWAIPVLYARAPAAFEPSASEKRDVAKTRVIDRDAEYFRMERCVRTSGAVALGGLAGIGKTTLANDFAQWLVTTSLGQGAVLSVDASGCKTLPELANRMGAPMDVGATLKTARGPVLIDGLDVVQNWSENDRSTLFAQIAGRRDPRVSVILAGRGLDALVEGIPCLKVEALSREALSDLLPPEIERSDAVLTFLDGHPGCARSATPGDTNGRFPVQLGGEALAPVRAALATLDDTTVRQLRLIAGHGSRLEFQSLKHLTGYFRKKREDETAPREAVDETVPEGVGVSSYEDWEQLIEHCCDVHLADRVEGDIYRLHPGLGPVLVERWRGEAGARFENDWASLQEAVDDSVLATAGQLSIFMAIGTPFARDRLPGAMRMLDPGYVRTQLTTLEPRIKEAILRGVVRDRELAVGLAAQALGMLWSETASPDLAYCDTVLCRLGEDSKSRSHSDAYLLRYMLLQQLALSRLPSATDAAAELRHMLSNTEGVRELGAGVLIGRAEILLLLAIALDVRGRPREAEPFARQAEQAFAARGDPSGVARAKHAAATILRNLGRNSAAFAIETKVDATASALTPSHALEQMHRRAVESFDDGNRQVAMDHQLAILSAAGQNPRLRARAMHELGLLCSAEGRLEDAERWLLKSLAIKDSLFGPSEGVRTLLMLGEGAVERGRDDEAEQWFIRAMDAAGPQDSTAISAQISLAGISARRGHADAALDRVLLAFSAGSQHHLSSSAATFAKARKLLESVTPAQVEAHWRNRAEQISPDERRHCADAFARLGLLQLAVSVASPLVSSDDPELAASALVLQAQTLCEPPSGNMGDALRVVDAAIRRLESADLECRGAGRTLGSALRLKAVILRVLGEKLGGADVAAHAVETLRPFREDSDTIGLADYAAANGILGGVAGDLGRWEQAAEAHIAEAEAYRLCVAGGFKGYRQWRFDALHRAIVCLINAGNPERALSYCTALKEELSVAFPGSDACVAEPPMGVVIQATVDALDALGDRDAAHKVVAERWTELERLVDHENPGVCHEHLCWSLYLLEGSKERDRHVASRMRAVLTATFDLHWIQPEHCSAISEHIWRCLQHGDFDVAAILRDVIAALERGLPERLDVAAAAARADFDFTLGRGLPTTVEDDEAIVGRLRDGTAANADPLTGLRLAFAVQHAVAKRIEKGESKRAVELAASLEDVALPRPELVEVCRDAFFGCRRNLAFGFERAGDLDGAVAQVRRILELAIETGTLVRFDGDDVDRADKSAGGRSDPTAGSAIIAAVTRIVAKLAEARRIDVAVKLLLACLDAIVEDRQNDLVVAMVFAGCSNLLLRVPVPLQGSRDIHAGIAAARRKRPDSDLLRRAFAVSAMNVVFAERTKGDIVRVCPVFEELVALGSANTLGALIAQTGLGLAKDLVQRGDIAGLIATLGLMLPAICRCTELGPAIADISGGVDFAIDKCLDAKDVATAIALLESARSLRELYAASAELRMTVALGIVNLIGRTGDPLQFRAWLVDLRALDSASQLPDVERLQSIGVANAILGAGQHALPDVADDLYRELVARFGVEPGRPRPEALVPAFSNRVAVLRRYGRMDLALDELFGVACNENRSSSWIAATAAEVGELVAQLWSTGTLNQRHRLTELVRELSRDPNAFRVLQTKADRALLETVWAGS